MTMLGAPCSSCCASQCDCAPDTVTVDVADEDRLGIHEPSAPGRFEWGSQAQFDGFGPYPNGRSSLEVFPKTDLQMGQNQTGGHYSCAAPSSLASLCMRLTRPRLLDFRNAIRGAYQLTRTPSCKEYVYVNDAPCAGNFIRHLRLQLVEDAGAAYEMPVLQTVTVGRSSECTTTFSTLPGRGKSGWIEYRMSAEVCIAGDAGNMPAAGCDVNANFLTTGRSDPTRCNCYPNTIQIQGQINGPYVPGPCSYSGATCYATLQFFSVGSLLDRNYTLNQFNLVGRPYSAINFRALWAQANDSVPAVTRPFNPLSSQWCELDVNLPSASVTGNAQEYQAAQCFQFPFDVYFGLFSRSSLGNAMPNRTYFDSFGFGVKLRKTVTP